MMMLMLMTLRRIGKWRMSLCSPETAGAEALVAAAGPAEIEGLVDCFELVPRRNRKILLRGGEPELPEQRVRKNWRQ